MSKIILSNIKKYKALPVWWRCREAHKIAECWQDAAPELETAFANGDWIVVCWEPGCRMHRLPHWPKKKWMDRSQQQGYRNYSQSICRSHYRVYQQEIQRAIAEEAVAFSASTTNVATA